MSLSHDNVNTFSSIKNNLYTNFQVGLVMTCLLYIDCDTIIPTAQILLDIYKLGFLSEMTRLGG